jgi:hypothetical protein
MVSVLDPLTRMASATASPTLTREPIFLVGVPSSFAVQARANLRRVFNGGSDFSKVNELFVDYDAGSTSGGLFTMSEASVAASVLTYGGSARSGDIPGGQMFAVHPSFLNNTALPIEITVEVRRKNPAVSAGFNLKYEARTVSGFKSAPGGWYTIPAGTKWVRKTWRLNDARFVWNWGYNFNLDSDGVYNQYDIRSIRVKKIGQVAAEP